MGRFQLELIYYFTYFSIVVPSNICVFICCRPFVVNTRLSKPTEPIENESLQETITDRLGGLVVIAPARRAGDPGSDPGPGENFSLKLLISTCQMVILETKFTFKNLAYMCR